MVAAGIPITSAWRPMGTVAGESGVHSTGYAMDMGIPRNTPVGQRVIQLARQMGYYVYDKEHGTGPHIHIEFNRNPDGSAKR